MPEMYEIYDKYADHYHELISAENAAGNLWKTIETLAEWENASVLEAGVGTGRVTRLYVDRIKEAVCCDRSDHMVSFARHELEKYDGKVKYLIGDNVALANMGRLFDVFIEGWSFGHTVSDCAVGSELASMVQRLVNCATGRVRDGGSVIMIETLGTNTDAPAPPHEKLRVFYEMLEERYGFEQQVIRTDYQFQDVREAVRVMGFSSVTELPRDSDGAVHPRFRSGPESGQNVYRAGG